jgi:protein-L-isoaspartate(D-aspartate) O-methyltransferase
MSEANSDALRLHMINGQLRTCDVNDLDLLTAFAAVPRERFAAVKHPALAYTDGEVASLGPKGRKLLSPRSLGLLLKTAEPVKGGRVLVVGGGAGYCAAVLAALGCQVVALETDSGAARAIGFAGVECVDGALDSPPAGQAPFDIVVINGAFEVAPERLIKALKPGGRLVGLSARAHPKRVVLFENIGGAVSERDLYDAAGDVLPGLERAKAFSF